MAAAEPARSVFAGDLDDPWVAAMVRPLPPSTRRHPLPGEIPARWPDEVADAETLILHRSTLSAQDYVRFSAQRRAGFFPRLILCVGPHARHAAVQPWAELAEMIVSEVTALETLARHVEPLSESLAAPPQRPDVFIVSPNVDQGAWLEETCAQAGHAVSVSRTWHAVNAPLAVWPVPVLDPTWPERLSRYSLRWRVLLLIALADRASVHLARAKGAAACLDLPCEPADIQFVLARMSKAETESRLAAPSERSGSSADFCGRSLPQVAWDRLHA